MSLHVTPRHRSWGRTIFAGRILFAAAISVTTLACWGGRSVTTTFSPASYEGRLQGGVSAGPEHGDCLWLETASGRRVDVIFPDGWDARFHPLELVDATGRVVARDGDLLRVTGEIGPGGGESACTSGPPFPASSVERLGG
jgi:hypothetical protein